MAEDKVLYNEKYVLDDAHGTEIISVSDPDDDEYFSIHYVQGDRVGCEVVANDVLDEIGFYDSYDGGPEIPVQRKNGMAMVPVSSLNTVGHTKQEAALELVNRGILVLPDLAELPKAEDLGPVLADLYNEAVFASPEMIFVEEYNLNDILKSSKGMPVEDICKSVEDDMEKYPSLRKVVEVNPDGLEEGEPVVTCYMAFASSFAQDYDREKNRSVNPFMLNQTSEEVLGCVKEAISKELEVIEACKEHNINRQPRKLEEALYAFGHTFGKQVLQVLKKETSRTKKEKDCTVLDGALKYESQHDRKEALKQVKSWMKKPCDKVAEEIEKLQEKNRRQGR